MPTRVSHEDPSVKTWEGTVIRRGSTTRPAIECQPSNPDDVEDVVRLVLDGSTYFAKPVIERGGACLFDGAYDMPEQATDPGTATNRLLRWFKDRELEFGRTVYIDEVVAGFRYGVRAPGEAATYDGTGPDGKLSDIARDL